MVRNEGGSCAHAATLPGGKRGEGSVFQALGKGAREEEGGTEGETEFGRKGRRGGAGWRRLPGIADASDGDRGT